jgi:hypothetical protein
MPYYIKNNLSMLFIHIPKAGGTSIENFFDCNLFDKEWIGGIDHKKKDIEPSPQHRHRDLILKHLKEEKKSPDYMFTFIRNPIDRLISQYFQQLTMGCKKHYPVRSQIIHDGFDSWVDQVFKLAREKPSRFDNHMRPQHEFICPGTKIFKLEDGHGEFITCMKRIAKIYNIYLEKLVVDKLNQGRDKKPVEMQRSTLNKIIDFYEKDFTELYPQAEEEVKSDLIIR